MPRPASAKGQQMRAAVSLVEVLVVTCVMAILAGLVLAAVQRARESAARVSCASNLRQMALAVHSYSDAGRPFPKGCDQGYSRALLPGQPWYVGLSWQTAILPHVEQQQLWATVEAAHRADPLAESAAHDAARAAVVPVYLCPSDGRREATDVFGNQRGLCGYVGVAGTGTRVNDGVFHVDFPVRPTDITDGMSNTVMIGEHPPGPNGVYGQWYANWGDSVCPLAQIVAAAPRAWVPTEAVGCSPGTPSFAPGSTISTCAVGHFWSLHPTGANFAFADGSVRFLRYTAADTLPALATRAGGEVIDG